MKRILSIAMALMMVGAFCVYDTHAAYGEEYDLGSIGNPEVPESLQEQDGGEYMSNAALVMFRATDKITKAKAKSTLRSGTNKVSDLTVESLWTFESKGEPVTNSQGVRKIRKSALTRYDSVALVRSESLSTEKLVKRLNARRDVLYAEPNYRIHALSVSNDPYSDYQWSMQNGDTTPNVTEVWTKTSGNADSIVAVVDTGIDYTHPDLKNNMWENTHYPKLKGECGFDFIGGDADPMDENGHGTHCAGIIGATGDNNIGTCGVNKKVRLMALRILDAEGSAWMSHEVAAYNYINLALDLGEPVRAINNSWGGGEDSGIFRTLVDVVGEKGAITVCAAGNESNNNDEEENYPACIESPYLISVAATKEDGTLASFSNYGEKTVDVAAPGADILSTVSYGCYNPTIYGETQDQISEHFNNYDGEETWGFPGAEAIYLNGELYNSESHTEDVSVTIDPEGGFLGGKSMEIKAKNMKEGDLLCMPVPYEISRNATVKPFFSAMSMAAGPKDVDFSLVGFIDTEQGMALDLDTLGDMELYGTYLRPEGDCWDHITMECLEDEDLAKLIKEAPEQTDPGDPGVDPADPPTADPLKRQVVIILYAAEAGDFTWHLDDLGMSRQTLDSKKLDDTFGKYDFMSGTSMATPFVSGSIAQKAAELKLQGSQVDPETLVNETVSLAKASPALKVMQKGSFDFTKRPPQLGPRIGKVTVDTAKKTLTIKGSGLDPQGVDLKVEVGDVTEDEETLQEAEIVSKSDRAVTIKDKGWINNIKTVRVTGFDGKQNTREDVYLVRGKKKFTKVDGSVVNFGKANTTDGKYVYVADSFNKMISQINPNNLSDENANTFFLNPKQIFKIKNADTARYTMVFGTDLAYIDGKLYNVLEYGQYDTPEPEDDFIIIFSGNSYATEEEKPDDSDSVESGGSIYSGELRLVSVDTKHDGKAVNLGTLPASLESTADWTMATYNGKLYFMGGYNYGKDNKGFTKNVHIYDPKTKKWSKGPALKEARAGGKALQVGNKLIYTMGYAPEQTGVDVLDQKYPANLIFDGKQWTVSKKAQAIEPAVIGETVKRGGNEYITSAGSISLMKNGIVYTGVPAVNYGDTFVYNVGKDAFADSGYNFAQDIDDTQISGISVGGTLFGTSEDTLYKMPVANGLVKVTAAKAKGGSVKGTGSYLPGSKATIKVSAAKFYEIKSLKQGKKTIKLGKNKRIRSFTVGPLTADQKITAKFQKYKVKVTVKKKGKGKVTGAKKYTAGATATIKVKAAKGYVIKSIRVGKKAVKVKKNATTRTFKIKKMAANYKVTVIFKKAK